MQVLIQNCTWIQPGEPHSGETISIRIKDGKVSEIGHLLTPENNENLIDATGYFASPGWIDLKCGNGVPSNPQNETAETLSLAAAAGGFTSVQISPNQKTIIQSVESVSYYRNFANENGIRFLVSGAATQNLQGNKMAEILTLAEAGAVSFSSVFPITNARFMTNLLLYMQHAEAVLIHSSWDPVLATGQIHEGLVSHNRGLEGIPSLAEEIMVERDISILQYTGGKLHVPCVSAAGSVAKLFEAKKNLPGLSYSIAAHQLLFTEQELDSFQTVHKVFPPYRLETDRQALIDAVKAGETDAIVSDHNPLNEDFKVIEFGNASFGISSLETTYSALMTAIPDLSPEIQVNLLASGPRKILGLETIRLEPGALADITIFSPDKEWIPTQKTWQSRSLNSPFLDRPLKGVVKGVVTSTGYHPNPHLAEAHS